MFGPFRPMRLTESNIPPERATPRAALAVVVGTVTLDAIGIGLIFPVMPALIEEVTGRPLAEAALWGGLLATSYAVMQFLFGPLVGALSDRFGRRPVLMTSLAVMAADYVILALAPTVWLLLAARVLAGIAAATHSTAAAFIADITPPADRGRRFGLIGAGFGVGFVLGPLIGGLLAGFDTRAPFWGAAALAALNLAAAAVFLPESLAPALRRPLSRARMNPLGALRAVGRLRAARAPLATFLILGIAMNVYPAIWAFYGTARFGWDTPMIGLSLALYGVCFAIGQAMLVGPLIRRFGEHRAAFWGMWVDVSTLAALGVVTSGALALVITPFTALGGVVTPALQAILSRQTSEDAQGELQGVLASLNAVAMIVSPLVMTATFAAFTREGAPIFAPGAPFLLAAAMMVVAVAIHVAGGRARTAPAA